MVYGEQETADPDSRGRDRHRRIALTAIANGTARLISIATLFVSIPLTLHYLGPERYGLWLTIGSVGGLLSFMDLGIGAGLMNGVAEAYGRNDADKIRRLTASALAVLLAVAAVALGVLYLVRPFVPWSNLFNVHTALARTEAEAGATTFIVIFALSVPAGIIQRVQLGIQRGFTAGLWQCAASLFGLAGILVAIRMHSGVAGLIVAYFGAPLLTSLLNALIFYFALMPALRPGMRMAEMPLVKYLSASGANFLILQVTTPIIFSLDAFILSRLLGAANVPQYTVPERMFSVVSIVLSFVMAPLWPAYGEALARGDHGWIRKTLRATFTLAVASAAIWSGVLLMFGRDVLAMWVGRAIHPTMGLLIALAALKIIEAGGNTFATFLNACNIVRMQVWWGLAMAVVSVALKLLLVPQVGVAGIALGTLFAAFFCGVIPFGLYARRVIYERVSPTIDRADVPSAGVSI